jgi:hypothetical protein
MHRMGRKMDHLERSIGELMHDAGLDKRQHQGLSSPSSIDERDNKDPATTTTPSTDESPSKTPPKTTPVV